MKGISVLAVCLALAATLESVANEVAYPDVIRIGTTAFWGKHTPMAGYGDGNPLMDWPVGLGEQVRMWKIGDGVLIIEHTAGLVRIVKMTYVLKGKEGKAHTCFPVRGFNHLTGEMTILVPNKAHALGRSTAGAAPRR